MAPNNPLVALYFVHVTNLGIQAQNLVQSSPMSPNPLYLNKHKQIFS